MARLYQYADSNEKSGLFLLDAYKGENTTFQVSQIAEELFHHLEYEPGILNRKQGPRIPDELQWALFEIGWIDTGKSEKTISTDEMGELILSGETIEITEEIADRLISFLKETEDVNGDVEELAKTLNLDVPREKMGYASSLSTNRQTPICEISNSRWQKIANQVAERIERKVKHNEESDWEISRGSAGKINSETEQCQIVIKTESDSEPVQRYFHKIIFSPESELQTIWTILGQDIDWKDRADLETRRGQIISSVMSVASEEMLDIGHALSELNHKIEWDPIIKQQF